MRTKSLLLLVVISLTSCYLNAQQDAQYTQYMYNTLSINPAYAGSRGILSLTGLHRSQWVGLDGAPTTQTLNVHAPISERVGLGLSVINDVIGNGTNQDTYFDTAFAYTIPVSLYGDLSFGLKVGVHLLNIDFNKLKSYRTELNNTSLTVDRRVAPNFGTGLYYHTANFYLGLSVPNILQTQHFDDSDNTSSFLATERMNWYLISGYVWELNPFFEFKPAMLVKAVNGAPLQVDLSANFRLEEKYTFGLAYRWDAAISGLLGFQVSPQMMIGLAYDRETTALGNTAFNNGSFEFFLRYEFRNRFNRMIAPRFF